MTPSMNSCLEWLRKAQHGKIKGLKWVRRSNQDHAAPIYRLPPELVQDLAKNFLEPFEAALLTLCSKRFCFLLGTQYWRICKYNREQGNKLLSVWERECPQTVHCVPCAKFHRLNSTPYVNPNWKCQFLELSIRLSFPQWDYRPKFIYIQTALKRHRLGQGTKKYIKAFNHERQHFANPINRKYYSIAEARIVSGELLVRGQEWRFYPAECLSRGFPTDVYLNLYPGCSHRGDGSVHGQLNDLLRGKTFDWDSVNRPDHYGGLRQCRFCYTEFQFDILPFVDIAAERPNDTRYYDRYVATVKTTWTNFGDGNPAGHGKYRRQFLIEWGRLPFEAEHIPAIFELGSIRDAFEQGQEFCFEKVLPEKKLRGLKTLVIEYDKAMALSGYAGGKRSFQVLRHYTPPHAARY